MTPREAARRTMDEVGGALVAIALVLSAVFVPTAFIPGISGQFYRQFALTIASATLISCLVSLTLSPALAALLLRPRSEARPSRIGRLFGAFFDRFNAGFDRLSNFYGIGVGQGGARLGADAGRLRRAPRPDRRAVLARAGWLHPGTRPGLLRDGRAAAAGRVAGAHRCGGAAGDQGPARDPRHRAHRELQRVRRRVVHQCQQLRDGVLYGDPLCRAGRAGRRRGRRPPYRSTAHGRDRGGEYLRHRAAIDPRPERDGRLQADRPGPDGAGTAGAARRGRRRSPPRPPASLG